MSGPDYSVVIPTVGRASLRTLLDALAAAEGPAPREIVVVDDRPRPGPLPLSSVPAVRVLRSGGRGPAAARNTGWRAVTTEWVAFLDDDVLTGARWPAQLHADLAGLDPDVGGSQALIEVPLPADRPPTDHERGIAGLATARWITADMAYRHSVLQRVGGFDERFPRAFREDADLALRVADAGYRLVVGQRRTTHPVRPAGFLASVRAQAGNADNALMRRRYGQSWRARIGEGPGRLRQHALTTAAGLVAAFAVGRRRRFTRLGSVAAILWAALTAEFALRRILPGPHTAGEITKMVLTSFAIPPVACAYRLAGELRWRAASPLRQPERDHADAELGYSADVSRRGRAPLP